MMKTALRNYSTQKGFSPIIIVIILAIIGVGAFIWKNSSNSTSSSNTQPANIQTQIDSKKVSGLEQTENSAYTFYYPKDYAKLDEKRKNDTILFYSSSKAKDSTETISLDVTSMSSRAETPTVEYCQGVAQFVHVGNKNFRIVDATPVDFIKSHGCSILYVDDSVQGKLYYHEKSLWYKEASDLNIYTVVVSYLLTAPQGVREPLDLAVNSFILK